MKQANMHQLCVEHQIRITAPIEKVWSITVDISYWPRWCPTIQDASVLGSGELTEGTQFTLKQPMQRARTWQIEQLCPPRYARWRTRDGEYYMAEHKLHARDGESVSTLRLTFTARHRVLTLVKSSLLQMALASENKALKRISEAMVRVPR